MRQRTPDPLALAARRRTTGDAFDMGVLVVTPLAEHKIIDTNTDALLLLNRHLSGDWGDVGALRSRANTDALRTGARLLSVYTLADWSTVWILTEPAGDDARRLATTILLPEDY